MALIKTFYPASWTNKRTAIRKRKEELSQGNTAGLLSEKILGRRLSHRTNTLLSMLTFS